MFLATKKTLSVASYVARLGIQSKAYKATQCKLSVSGPAIL